MAATARGTAGDSRATSPSSWTATAAGHRGVRLPRHLGHRAGAKAVRVTIEGCARRGVEALTLFAFSSENWQRPEEEVARLMELFVEALDREVDELQRNGIRLRFIGDLEQLRDRCASAWRLPSGAPPAIRA